MSESKKNDFLHAQMNWSDQSAPKNPQFDNLAFNTEHTFDESHTFYLQANQLLRRWSLWEEEFFCIAEMCFGNGLNFLLTCQVFEKFLQENPDKPLKRLLFSSFEQQLLSKKDIELELQKWPTLNAYITPLLAQYPLALIGCHRLNLANITLDLWLGDIIQTLPTLYCYPTGIFDCWYLNGFKAFEKTFEKTSESKNNLFESIAVSCKQDASFSAFTSTSITSDFVSQALQSAGFNVHKTNQRNQALLTGTLVAKKNRPSYSQFYRPSKTTDSKEIAIIGGGISSACLSLALIQRGFKVTLYCKDNQLASGASGNQQGALYPLLNKQHNALSQLFANSFLYARNYVEHINESHPFDFDLSGLLQLYYDPVAAKKLDKILQAQLPCTLVKHLSCEQTDQLSHLDIGQQSLFYPLAGWLSPTQLVNAIFKKAIQTGLLTIKLNHQLDHFEQQDGQWCCHFDKQTIKHDLLVLTTAMNTLNFKQGEALPLSAARGQVTHIDSNQELQKLALTVCHEGYLTPINNGKHCMGATFKRHTLDEAFSLQEQQDNKDKLAKCIKDKNWVEQIACDHHNAHIGIRCTTRDHFPYMGALPNYQQTKLVYQQAEKKMPSCDAPFHQNLFILTGLGSRGLNTAPLLAETLASQINQEPLPLTTDILNSLQCNRQWVNYLKKGKVLNF